MARTPEAGRWERVRPLTAPRTDPYVRPPGADENPIYDRLAREWSTAGRTLPGADDGEWGLLTRFPQLPGFPEFPGGGVHAG
ncbi:hypothetical protein GCM10010232_30840 [Streptomyces amakusaensis]|uniref:Uncharacterized protein n=1 Tax=Streptomyces amakusaensis TaxID=67271 RepID=A0ABW0AAB1_9ACTN